ncbi:glycosyltransferase family 39 protein [Pseudonocardia ailaonensis]|uniref:Glycosyltransferase family 39 protein n=1 Tax=Pseudonocardia ailaonensis TaxID=367279 RepID=A0ABN2NCT2_9PSEU
MPAAVLLVVAAAIVGRRLVASGVELFLGWPPLLAEWLPHVGPGTPAAVVVAVGTVVWGPELAARLRWGALLAAGWAAAFAWTLSLALVDGWQRGVVERLTSGEEYLHDVPRVAQLGGIGPMLRVFSDHILTTAVDPAQTWFWTTHVGGHPAGAFLLFTVLDRIGLGSGGAAGVVVMLVGSSAAVAVAVTLRALGHEDLARRVLPFSVLFPGAVWVGVSADGLFAGWLAWGVALLALARGPLRAFAAGLVLGYALYLSYGLVLGALFPLAVLLTTRRWTLLVPALAGVLVIVAAFTAAGFWWFTGYEYVKVIYAASAAASRPYAYFLWANLAALAFALGPATIAALGPGRETSGLPRAATWLVGAAGAAILLADLSGMSKAEVERIWLPFAVWAVVACGALPRPRRWLVAQAALALVVNHLLLTVW